jgi:small subunit ribosomal protein S16
VAKGALTQEQADAKFEAWKAQKDAKFNTKVANLAKAAEDKVKASQEVEAKVNADRADALAKKKAEAEAAAKAEAEAAAAAEAVAEETAEEAAVEA